MTDAPGRTCHCRLCEPPDDTIGEADHELLANVETIGWHALQIVDGDVVWVFTVGLWHTYGAPELAMFGLHGTNMHYWISQLVERLRDGESLAHDVPVEGILGTAPVLLRPVQVEWYPPLFGYAMWFQQRGPLPISQVVWPDRDGTWPWEDGCGEHCRTMQPSLWLRPAEHPEGIWTADVE